MSAPPSYDENAVLVWNHVRDNAHVTLRDPSGALLYKYVCPGGFYSQLWCWDSFFAGVGLLQPPFNGGPYLLGSMMNFLHYTNPETGEVPGCLTPNGPSTTLAHAKPVIIQGAYLGAKAVGPEGVESLREFLPKMRALLSFWERERRDPATGLYRWWDTMESGADDLVYFYPPSKHTPSWNDKEHALSHSAPDVNIFLAREHRAFALLLAALHPTPSVEIAAEMAASHEASKDILSNMASKLWCAGEGGEGGYWGGLNTRTGALLPDRTYQMAWPLWEGAGSETQRQAAFTSIMAPDMRGRYGIRSTSSSHPRFSLEDAIIPYSIWRGPVWMNVNFVLCYAFQREGKKEEALKLAKELVHILAMDLRTSGAWHECYNPDSGAPLSKESKGFFSWTVMAAGLLANLEAGVDPTTL